MKKIHCDNRDADLLDIARKAHQARVCSRKRKYESAERAKGMADYRQAVTPGLRLHVYKCHTCQRWHLTKNPL